MEHFIKRTITDKLLDMAAKFPVVFLTGPRQSGKSTLLKNLFLGKYEYVSLEEKDIRDFAINDPRGFLNSYKDKLIIDEAQRAPDLFSYIQTKVDDKGISGMYILSGSMLICGLLLFFFNFSLRSPLLKLVALAACVCARALLCVPASLRELFYSL